MGRWDEAENVIKNLWGEGEVEVAMEELRAASSNEGEDEDITWSELIQAPYFKGRTLFYLEMLASIIEITLRSLIWSTLSSTRKFKKLRS